MKDKLIELIKKYRAASEKRWSATHGYKNEFAHGQSNAYDRCADDLEELVRHLSEASSRQDYSCSNCGAVVQKGTICSFCGTQMS